MKTIETTLEGTVTYWSVTDTTRQTLVAAWERRDLPYGLLPAEPRPITLLRAAVEAVMAPYATGGRRVLVRRTARPDSLTAVREIRGHANQYETLCVAWVRESGGVAADEWHPEIDWRTKLAEAMQSAYVAQTDHVPAAAVGRMLTAAVEYSLGVRLRDKGGVYWIPEGDGDANWRRVAAAVEHAGAADVYVIRHACDADALRAVRDGLIGEVESAAAQARAAIDSGELGARGLESQRDELKSIARKIAYYEGLLSERLPQLAQLVSDAETAAALAQLQAAAA